MRHGGTWRMLPGRFGKHDPVRKPASRWAQKGTRQRLFAGVRLPDMEAAVRDSTSMRAHRRVGPVRTVLADKAYDTNASSKAVEKAGTGVVIPGKKNRLQCRLLDRMRNRRGNQVERFFNRLEAFCRLATRYEKTVVSFLGCCFFFAALCWCD